MGVFPFVIGSYVRFAFILRASSVVRYHFLRVVPVDDYWRVRDGFTFLLQSLCGGILIRIWILIFGFGYRFLRRTFSWTRPSRCSLVVLVEVFD